MEEEDMELIGRLMSRALNNVGNETELAEVKREVGKICDRFPLYAARLAAYDAVLASR
jgi:glycine hydroxymethyltransferase